MEMKGQIQVQFNWIFVLIVGGLILIFFTNVVLKYQETSEGQTALTVINDLQTIATGAGVSKGTAQKLNKPDVDLLVSCGIDEDCDCNFEMSGNSKRFGDIMLFAPTRITGREMVAWTLDWNSPFRVTNFLYLTSPDVMYYLVNLTSSEVASRFVNETLPNLLNYEYISSLTGIADQNYPVIKVVYFGNCGTVSLSDALIFKNFDMDKDDVSAVCITADPPLFDRGTLQFYKVNNAWNWIKDGSPINFTGDESMFAAIFAGSYHNFECNMKESFKRMETIVDIYIKRTGDLRNSCANSGNFLYFDANETLHHLKSNASYLSVHVNGSYSDLYRLQKNMSYHNSQLQIRSCPSIY